MTEETAQSRSNRIFSDNILDLIGHEPGRFDLKMLKKIRPVVIVGRSIADGQSFDSIIDTYGRVKVHETPLTEIGVLYDSNDVAGNTTVTNLVAAGIIEVTGLQLTYNCDGNAGNRLPKMTVRTPFGPAATGVANTAFDLNSVLTLSLGEDGGILHLRNGIEVINDNSVITVTAAKSALPMEVGTSGSIEFTATGGLAGDVMRGIVYGRRIA